jgi:DNA gyrase/topoisomerase IV subunit A
MAKKIYNLPISKQINTNFRNYALYVLENRGIPSFYDGLTNVQRFILVNAPSNYHKTISVVGSCISDGYHHGDKSLTGAVNKLARPFGCSEQLLLGDGFFGTPVQQEPSAARYTSVKIAPGISDMIRKNTFLNTRNDETGWDPLWVDLPIGLSTTIIGIAVGYKTTVLPRSMKDVQKYLDGKLKEVKPYFKDFSGKITRFKGMDKSWLIEGVAEKNVSERWIRVTELPPLMKYGSFLKKLDAILNYHPGVKVTNNSSTNVDIHLRYSGNEEGWVAFSEAIERSIKMLVTETPVFVKDGLVLEYDRIEDYIEDFKYRRAQLRVERAKHFLREANDELEFARCKEKYLMYMLETQRKENEVEKFLNGVTKNPRVKRRLESIYLKSLNEQELERTRKEIKRLEELQAQQTIELAEATKILESMVDTATSRGTSSKTSSAANLFEDEEEIDGIAVWDGDLEPEEETTNQE